MNNNSREQNIENFIGVYDNWIPAADCKKTIEIFERAVKFKHTVNRQHFENAPLLQKEDNQFFASNSNHDFWFQEMKYLLVNFDVALKHYERVTGVKEAFDIPEFNYTTLKIQKTLPTQGYHVWHVEHGKGFDNQKRALVFTIYLNDVEEGGETEFLHFSKRIKPKTGRVVIWPASFPYVHRGNPPLSGDKYLLTSWMILG